MSDKVKVLEVLPGLNYGGSQAMIVNICKAIDKKRIQCDFVIDHEDLIDMKPLVEGLGSKVYVMPSFKGTNILEIKKAWNDFFNEHQEYQIIHSHIRSYAAIFLKIAKRHGLKTIIHSHNTSNGKGLGSLIKNILQLPLRNIADYFFACSLEAGEWLFGEKVCKSDKFHVINNAIDTDRFSFNEDIRNAYREKFGLHNEKVFIQVGRFTKQKNYLFTIDIFNKYLETDPEAKLFIVGDGEMEEEVINKINRLNINERVIILSHRSDIDSLLQMADYYLMPSIYEGLSVAAVEAQASGIRCLLSDQIDRNVEITELCTFIPLNVDAWVKEMSKAPGLRLDTKDDIIKAGFDVNTTARWLRDFYESIV